MQDSRFPAAWLAYIGGSVKLSIGMQIVAFLALLFIDLRLRTDLIYATS